MRPDQPTDHLIELLDAARDSIPICLLCNEGGLNSRISIAGTHPPMSAYHIVKREDQSWDQAVHLDCPRTDAQIRLLKVLDEIEGHPEPGSVIQVIDEDARRERALGFFRAGI